jgi:hypothetical protein
MKKTLIALAALSLATLAFADRSEVQHGNAPEDLSVHGDPPMLGAHLTREAHGANADHAAGNAVANSSANMSYHGGKIMTIVNSKAIFWGPSWNNATFAGDKMTGLNQFYSHQANTSYAATVNEYTGSNGKVASAGLTHAGSVIDPTAASSSTSAVLAAVCRNIKGTSLDTNGNGYYPVYTDIKRGNAQYCAWHSYGTCGGVPVQFAFFFNLDGDSGCDPQDKTTGHSQGLAALANVSGHEISEARSDPASPGAWYDKQGAENSDKCAWTFGTPAVTFSDGSKWKVQGNWSNAAYTSGTGYPNSSGLRGCINGS